MSRYQQRHVAVFPALNGSIDMEYQTRDASGIWFRQPAPSLLGVLVQKMIAAANGGQDLTWSSFRQFGLFDPANLPLPSNAVVRVFMPAGEPFTSEHWCSLIWHDPRREPIAGERFIATHDGLKLQLMRIFTSEMVDGLREMSKRPRIETWCRHTWKASEVAPGVLPVPSWMKAVEGLSPEDAANRMNQLRSAVTSPQAYYALRAKERQERERKAEQEEAEAFARQALQEALGQAELTSAPRGPAEPVPAASEPPVMTREDIQAARKKRDKARRATQSKVKADAFNKKSAEAFAAKRVSDLERQGKL